MAKTGTKRGKRWVAVAVLLLLAVASAGACAWWCHARFIDAPIDALSPGQTVMVESGDSFPKVLGKLRAVGVQAGSDLQWRLLARQMDVASKLKVGEYALEPGMSPRRLLLALRSGRIIQYRFTLVEGWNIRQLRTALAAASLLRQETASLDDAGLMQALGQPGQHPEGRFLPETYLYSRGDSDLDVLRRAHAAMQAALAEAWESRDPDLPLRSADEVLILASIIEKETGVADERPQIAGVFVRRLKIGMRLQTDPTVIYGIGADYDGNIRRRDLTTDTPYNTYTRDGLTPTPIAMPGRAALQAAVHPAPGDTLYFVAVGDGSGRHVFTRNLGEHNAAVAAYLQQLRQRRATGRTESQ